MQRTLLAVALALATGAPAYAVRDESPRIAKDAAARTLYIVSLADAPLAAYDGRSAKVLGPDGKALAGTSNEATGRRRLDVTSKASRDYLGHLAQRHAAFLAAASKAAGRALAPRFTYSTAANGMAIELAAHEALALAKLPGVASVRPQRRFRLDTDTGPALIGAPDVWSATAAGALATRGEGVVVGVVDTGINNTHPSFADVAQDGHDHTNPRGRFYGVCATQPTRCNDKLIGIYDFTDEGSRLGIDIDGHGTHTASTAAGNAITGSVAAPTLALAGSVSGVAPHANIVALKVCENEDPETSGCGEAALMTAFDTAAFDQLDVINVSISTDSDPWLGDGESYEMTVLNARAAGVLTVGSAGNAGPEPSIIGHTAPWTIAVAASTHGRSYDSTLGDVTGTGIAAPRTFSGASISGALAKTRIVHAKDFGNALCGTGAPQDPPTGASNPFPPGTFTGQIVICDRGTYGRVEKGFNLKLAGAGGMILANAAENGASVSADAHHLPTVHLGFAPGAELKALVENARVAGGTVSGAIAATTRNVSAASADVLADFSSRGPTTYGGVLKPNLTAPGVGILAASETGSELQFKSGTSMSSPHVAGAAALVLGAHPTWTPSQIESALETTATEGVRDFDGTLATPLETGAGRVDVPKAIRAGLYFDNTRAAYLAADPSAGGQPKTLNLPSFVDERCFESCSFQRTVTDMAGGGSWRVSVRGANAQRIAVSPTEFTLAPGASQALTVTATVTDATLTGTWVGADIVLESTNRPEITSARLPFYVFAFPGDVPAEVSVVTASNTAKAAIPVSGLAGIGDLTVTASSLAKSIGGSIEVAEDPTNNPFDDLSTVATRLLTLPASPNARTIVTRTASATAPDIDLFIGLDSDGDGTPDVDELVCFSASADASEECVVEVRPFDEPANFWIIVQNFDAGPTGRDVVDFLAAGPASNEGGTQFVATAPGRTARLEAFNVGVGVTEPRMQAGDTWLGFVELRASSTSPSAFGRTFVTVTTPNANGPGPIVLAARGIAGPDDAVTVDVPAGSAHERIVVDVPANATQLTVSMTGLGASQSHLYIAKAPAVDATSSGFAAAPARGLAQVSATDPGTTKTVTLQAPTLTPGRWYVTPVNTGTDRASLALTLDVQTSGNAPVVRANGYFNPSRSGHGVLLSEGGDQRVLIWYTYLPDGTPTWYLAQGPKPAATAGAWQAPLYRFTWDGAASHGTIVGEATLTPSATNAFTFAWLVDGQYGSEPMIELSPRACPSVGGTPTEFSGTWFAPQTPGYGFSVLTYASTEVQVAYLYDNQGVPRWLYGQNAPFGSGNFALSQFTGFCPSCAATAVSSRNAGTLVRTLADQGNGTTNVAGTFQSPVAGAWSTNQTTTKLTDNLGCN